MNRITSSSIRMVKCCVCGEVRRPLVMGQHWLGGVHVEENENEEEEDQKKEEEEEEEEQDESSDFE